MSMLTKHEYQIHLTTGADKDQPAGQQDLLGPGHLKDPHLGGQQHHLLLGARWACQFAEPAICILLDKLKYTQLQTRNTKLFIWSTLLLTKSTSGSRSPAGEGRLEMTHKVRILHITCWQHINQMAPKKSRIDRTQTTCVWWYERRRALGDSQEQAAVEEEEQIDLPDNLRMPWRSSTMTQRLLGYFLCYCPVLSLEVWWESPKL